MALHIDENIAIAKQLYVPLGLQEPGSVLIFAHSHKVSELRVEHMSSW